MAEQNSFVLLSFQFLQVSFLCVVIGLLGIPDLEEFLWFVCLIFGILISRFYITRDTDLLYIRPKKTFLSNIKIILILIQFSFGT